MGFGGSYFGEQYFGQDYPVQPLQTGYATYGATSGAGTGGVVNPTTDIVVKAGGGKSTKRGPISPISWGVTGYIPRNFGRYHGRGYATFGVSRARGRGRTIRHRVMGTGRVTLRASEAQASGWALLAISGSGHASRFAADASAAGRLRMRGCGVMRAAITAAHAYGFEDGLALQRQRLMEDALLFGNFDLAPHRQQLMDNALIDGRSFDLEDRAVPSFEERTPIVAKAISHIHAVADAHEAAAIRVVKRAFDAGKSAVDRMRLRAAVTSQNEHEVLHVMDAAITAFEKSFVPSVRALITEVRNESGKISAKNLGKLRAAAPAIRGFAFDVTNPKAIEWAHDHAAELVTSVSNTTRDDIRDLVEHAFDEQTNVDQLVDDIVDLVGDDARAELIARTEVMRASNEGQQEAWDQAVEDGLLTGNEQQEWITTPDEKLCPVCEPMDGVQVGLDENFEVDGDEIDGPPAHPNCRCTIGLVLAEPTNAQLRDAWPDKSGNDDHGRGPATRAQRARASYNPSTRAKQDIAVKHEQAVVTAVRGEHVGGLAPMDVVIKSGGKIKAGIEVKTIVNGTRDKITMHPDSRLRKESFVAKHGASAHTIAVDARGRTPVYYHREGFGSYRLHSMKRVSLSELHKRVRG